MPCFCPRGELRPFGKVGAFFYNNLIATLIFSRTGKIRFHQILNPWEVLLRTMVVFLRSARLGGSFTIGKLQQRARALLAPLASLPTLALGRPPRARGAGRGAGRGAVSPDAGLACSSRTHTFDMARAFSSFTNKKNDQEDHHEANVRPVASGVAAATVKGAAGQLLFTSSLSLNPQLGGWGFRKSARGLCSARKEEGRGGDGDAELSEEILKKLTVQLPCAAHLLRD